MKLLPLLFLSLGALHGAAETSTSPAIPALHGASVTLPYLELRALWEANAKAAAEQRPAPPVPHLLHRAELTLVLGAERSVLAARFEAESLDPQWQTILLLGGEAQLEQADAQIVWKDGYCLLAHQPGRTQAALRFATRGASALTPQNPLRLALGSATVKRLEVSGIPTGLEARVNGAPGELEHGVATFTLPGASGELLLELGAPRAVAKPPSPSRWQTQSQTLVRYAEGRLQFESRVFAHADEGSGLEMFLALPANAIGAQAQGEDVAEAVALKLDDGRRVLRVRWKTADVLDREVALTYAVPQSPLAEQWTLEAPRAPESAESRHLFAIVQTDGLELKGENVRAGVESRRLPQWMREAIAGAAFVTAEAGPQLAVQAHWLPTIATAEAIVTEAKAQLRLVADGSRQTTMSYFVRHDAPLAWQLELPPEVRILACQVNGRAAPPIQRERGIELALPTPSPAAKGATTVTLVHVARGAALDAVSGQVALELPRTPLFIERLDWSVALPAEFEVTAAEGNVSIAPPPPGAVDAGSITLRKDLCQGERPAVAVAPPPARRARRWWVKSSHSWCSMSASRTYPASSSAKRSAAIRTCRSSSSPRAPPRWIAWWGSRSAATIMW